MNIIWSPEATDDFETAVQFLASDNPSAANRLIAGVLDVVERLAKEPLDGPEHVLNTGDVVRGWPYPPFRIYYQRKSDTLHVLRVYHQKRRPIER